MPPFTLELVFKTPQPRDFTIERTAYVEFPEGLRTTTVSTVEPGFATTARIEGYVHEPGTRRLQIKARLGRYVGATWVGAARDEGVLYNGRGYIQAGLHENDLTEERMLYMLAELFDWNGVVDERPTT